MTKTDKYKKVVEELFRYFEGKMRNDPILLNRDCNNYAATTMALVLERHDLPIPESEDKDE